MSVIVSCPKCQKKLKIEDNHLGKNIKCPGCAAVFATKAPAGAAAPPPAVPKKAAPPPDDMDEDEAPRRPAKATSRTDDDDEDDRPAKKPAAKAARDDDYEDDDRPAKKPAAKASRDDDEDDRPTKKSAAKKGRASDDGDDDDDGRRTKKAKKKGGGAGKVLLIVGTIVLLLCGGCGGGIWYVYYKGKELVNTIGSQIQAQESKEPLTKAKPAAFPAGWKEFKQPKYGFSVWLPAGTPNPGPGNENQMAEWELPVPDKDKQAPTGTKSGYWIKVGEHPEADGSPFLTTIVLEALIAEAQGHVGGTAPVTNKKSGTIAGKPARSCTIPDPKGALWQCRVCLSGTKGYILLAGWDPKVSPTDADPFFDSFELK
jgi:hypothetical protein